MMCVCLLFTCLVLLLRARLDILFINCLFVSCIAHMCVLVSVVYVCSAQRIRNEAQIIFLSILLHTQTHTRTASFNAIFALFRFILFTFLYDLYVHRRNFNVYSFIFPIDSFSVFAIATAQTADEAIVLI